MSTGTKRLRLLVIVYGLVTRQITIAFSCVDCLCPCSCQFIASPRKGADQCLSLSPSIRHLSWKTMLNLGCRCLNYTQHPQGVFRSACVCVCECVYPTSLSDHATALCASRFSTRSRPSQGQQRLWADVVVPFKNNELPPEHDNNAVDTTRRWSKCER